ncbi:hypothetical protein FISHEDRAFT_55831 [Fistulina hepatica ATCC 64428]|uniref:Uncharacterized protein n=1 Tax=Fistulina hepatica ATCC 64428 TaxID=1128425 RepID=A0A0D7APA4_9AGAR|nr:hypothetical protein FISHEDRAFT_55831 [Fistulina hepatica ATCC 64428]
MSWCWVQQEAWLVLQYKVFNGFHDVPVCEERKRSTNSRARCGADSKNPGYSSSRWALHQFACEFTSPSVWRTLRIGPSSSPWPSVACCPTNSGGSDVLVVSIPRHKPVNKQTFRQNRHTYGKCENTGENGRGKTVDSTRDKCPETGSICDWASFLFSSPDFVEHPRETYGFVFMPFDTYVQGIQLSCKIVCVVLRWCGIPVVEQDGVCGKRVLTPVAENRNGRVVHTSDPADSTNWRDEDNTSYGNEGREAQRRVESTFLIASTAIRLKATSLATGNNVVISRPRSTWSRRSGQIVA